jgi:hypothetical protein
VVEHQKIKLFGRYWIAAALSLLVLFVSWLPLKIDLRILAGFMIPTNAPWIYWLVASRKLNAGAKTLRSTTLTTVRYLSFCSVMWMQIVYGWYAVTAARVNGFPDIRFFTRTACVFGCTILIAGMFSAATVCNQRISQSPRRSLLIGVLLLIALSLPLISFLCSWRLCSWLTNPDPALPATCWCFCQAISYAIAFIALNLLDVRASNSCITDQEEPQ